MQALLPEDSSIRGFDTVSRGLTTSATHLLSYQRAAAAAIDAALPKAPLASTVVRISGKKYLEGRVPAHRGHIDPFVRVEGESLVLHASLWGDNSMQAPRPSVPGRYRIRASVRPVNNGGKPMSVLIGKRVDRFQEGALMHIVDFADVPPGKATVIEAETDLRYSQGNQFIYFQGMSLPWFGDFEKQRGGRERNRSLRISPGRVCSSNGPNSKVRSMRNSAISACSAIWPRSRGCPRDGLCRRTGNRGL